MMATVPQVTSGLGLRKFQADGFLLTRVYNAKLLSNFKQNLTYFRLLHKEVGEDKLWGITVYGKIRKIQEIYV